MDVRQMIDEGSVESCADFSLLYFHSLIRFIAEQLTGIDLCPLLTFSGCTSEANGANSI